jgi:hypothetical protein
MKNILLFLLFLPFFSFAQSNKILYGYAYGMMHDGTVGGGVIGNVELLNFIGVGPGVELTSFDDHLMVPVFVDLKIKHRFENIDPYITGQFGRNSYNVSRTQEVTAAGGVSQPVTVNLTGRYFYGVGAGVAWHFNKVGVFASYIYRGYRYRYPDDIKINNEHVRLADRSVSANVFIIGIVF